MKVKGRTVPPPFSPTPVNTVDFGEFLSLSWLPCLCDPLFNYIQRLSSSSSSSKDTQSITFRYFPFIHSSALLKMAYYVQSTVYTKINEMQSHSSRRAKTCQTENDDRRHNERDKPGHHGNTGDEQGPWKAFSGTTDEWMMAKWCLRKRAHEQSTAVTPCPGQ